MYGVNFGTHQREDTRALSSELRAFVAQKINHCARRRHIRARSLCSLRKNQYPQAINLKPVSHVSMTCCTPKVSGHNQVVFYTMRMLAV